MAHGTGVAGLVYAAAEGRAFLRGDQLEDLASNPKLIRA
jgi:hypothetical protein